MPLGLTTIVDGTVADAADVNQYKAAIETLAGAGWNDGTGDLDVEELSDKIKSPGDGLEYTGGGALAIDLAANSGLEFDGGDLRIAAAAAGDGLTGGGGSALAVRPDNVTLELSADQVRVKDAGISVAKMAASVLSGRGNTAARPANAKAGFLYNDTQTLQVLRDTGAAWEEVSGTISAANVTDLTDGGITSLHCHPQRYLIWTLASSQAADNTAAPALQILQKDDTNNSACIVARISWYKTPEVEGLTLRMSYTVNAGGTDPRIILGEGIGGEIDSLTPIADGAVHTVEWGVDVSGLADDQVYELQISLRWLTAGDGSHDIQVIHLSLYAETQAEPS